MIGNHDPIYCNSYSELLNNRFWDDTVGSPDEWHWSFLYPEASYEFSIAKDPIVNLYDFIGFLNAPDETGNPYFNVRLIAERDEVITSTKIRKVYIILNETSTTTSGPTTTSSGVVAEFTWLNGCGLFAHDHLTFAYKWEELNSVIFRNDTVGGSVIEGAVWKVTGGDKVNYVLATTVGTGSAALDLSDSTMWNNPTLLEANTYITMEVTVDGEVYTVHYTVYRNFECLPDFKWIWHCVFGHPVLQYENMTELDAINFNHTSLMEEGLTEPSNFSWKINGGEWHDIEISTIENPILDLNNDTTMWTGDQTIITLTFDFNYTNYSKSYTVTKEFILT